MGPADHHITAMCGVQFNSLWSKGGMKITEMQFTKRAILRFDSFDQFGGSKFRVTDTQANFMHTFIGSTGLEMGYVDSGSEGKHTASPLDQWLLHHLLLKHKL